MNCQQIQKLIPAHHDGELDAANTMQVDEHLADCPTCFGSLRQLSALRGALQNSDLRFSAPAELRRSISAAVEQAAKAERETTTAHRPWFQYSGWAAAAVLLIASSLAFHFSSARNEDGLLADLTASHVRSLMVDHLTDVASTDQHTVKPWFDGKLDFAPPVKELRESGFPLLGGRLDFIDGHPAAALVYGRQKHFLNLFIWPASTPAPEDLRAGQRHGYNIIRWSDGKMACSVVSDLNETELREFVRDWSGK
ncbi:MAG: anti-sigma factor [Chthoniobacter sp.]|uniref:anti-sigma factor family protein n=1 Tax=Chthoniobacter sp. TaxID=2510640 RepID=UPI0032ADE1C3